MLTRIEPRGACFPLRPGSVWSGDGDPSVDTAEQDYGLAEAAYFSGASHEAARLSRKAFVGLRSVSADVPRRNELMGETALLHLVATAYGPVDRAANEELLLIAEEAETAAQCESSRATLAQVKAIRGHVLVRSGNVGKAINVMRSALSIAREVGDQVAEFVALIQLGKHLAKHNLEQSMDLRYAAYALYLQHLSPNPHTGPRSRSFLTRQFNLLRVYIGLGEFDRGNYGLAIGLLESGIAEMKKQSVAQEELSAALSHLSQVYAAIGLFTEAEQTLREAIRLIEGRDLHPWVSYNYGLLGKVQFDRGCRPDAVSSMRHAIRIADATQQTDLVTLVRNYAAELLIAGRDEHAVLRSAERIITVNLEDAKRATLHRSAALALSLLALLRVKQRRLAEAADYSTEAEEYIEAFGDMPALRTEEIHYNHFRVCLAIGRNREALRALRQAYSVLEEKRQSLHQNEHQRSFLEHVPLSRRIRKAYKMYSPVQQREGCRR